MRYAIIESGGKQYRAVEGETIEVDRLPDGEGSQIDLGRVLFMADGADVLIGTPTISGIEVRATIVEHFRGPKVTHFKYSPKKRIRVRGGHRQDYSRLIVDFIGRHGETRKVEKPAAEAGGGERRTAEAPETETPKKSAERKAPAKKAATARKSTASAAKKKSSK